jgi:uncharacterized membrane protein YgcG
MGIDARTLLIATATDAAVGLVCVLSMAALRAGAPLLASRLYTPRLEKPARFAPPPPGVPDPSWPAPPPLPIQPWRWAAALLRLDSATVAASAGADAAAFASLTLGFGLRLSVLLCFLCVPTLVPVNYLGGALPWAHAAGGGGRGGGVGGTGNNSSHNTTTSTNSGFSYFTDLDRLSLSNVEQGSPLMWAHLLAVYAVTLVTLWLLQTHSGAAAKLRVRALAAARPGAAVAARTVLVTDVPGLPYGTVAQRLGATTISRVAKQVGAALRGAQHGRRRSGVGGGEGEAQNQQHVPLLLSPPSFHVRLDELEEEVRRELDPSVEGSSPLAASGVGGIWGRAQAALRANGGDVEEMVRAEFERAYAGSGALPPSGNSNSLPGVVVAVHAVRRWPAAAAASAARLAAASQALAEAAQRRARQVERYWEAREAWVAIEAGGSVAEEEQAAAPSALRRSPPPPPQLARAAPAISPASSLASPEATAWLVLQSASSSPLDAVEGGAAWLRELRRRHEALVAAASAAASAAGGTTTTTSDNTQNLLEQLPAAFVTFRTRWTAAVAATALHSRAAGGAAAWQVRPAPEPDDVLWGGAAISVAAEAAEAAAGAGAGGVAVTTGDEGDDDDDDEGGEQGRGGGAGPSSPFPPSSNTTNHRAARTAAALADRAAAQAGAAKAAAAAAAAAASDPTSPQRLALREWERRARSFLLAACLLALGAFYTVPVGALQALLEVDALEKDFPFVRALLALPGIRPLLVAVLPGLALRLFIVALPAVLAALIRRAGGAAGMSEVDFAVARAYFGFQVWLVFFASFAAGSALAQARAMAASPERALRALGGAAPQTAGFFCSYLALQALLVRPLVLFRPWDAAALAIRTAVRGRVVGSDGDGGGGGGGNGNNKARTTAAAHRRPQTPDAVVGQGVGWQLQSRPYGAVLPNSTMAVLLAVAFAPVAPVLLPFAALFFGAALLTERHLAVYVVRRPFESGGRLWRHVRVQVVVALYVMQALALGLLLVKRFAYAPLVLPATLIVAAAAGSGGGGGGGGVGGFGGGGGSGGSGGGGHCWDTLSLEDARALDAAEARRDARGGVAEDARVERIRRAAAAYRSPPRLVDEQGVERLLALAEAVGKEAAEAERQARADVEAWRVQRERRG